MEDKKRIGFSGKGSSPDYVFVMIGRVPRKFSWDKCMGDFKNSIKEPQFLNDDKSQLPLCN